MEKNLDVKINCHSSICICGDIYIDPFEIKDAKNKAKVIFITHSHYDHFDLSSIKILADKNTIIVSISEVIEQLKTLGYNNLIKVEAGKSYEVGGIKFSTFASYNLNKPFHPKQNGNVGYTISYNDTLYTIVGDSDVTEELKAIKTDVLLIPIGGTYTMSAIEASELCNIIKPKVCIPTHYNKIVGDKQDEKVFLQNVNKDIKVEILI